MKRNDWKVGFFAGLIISMSISCEFDDPVLEDPRPLPTPGLPIPTAEPIRFGIYAPDAVPLKTPVVIVLCGKSFTREVYADEYKLGLLGDNRYSGCKQLVQPGFNTPGKRVIKIGNLEHVLDVFKVEPEIEK